MTQEEMDEFFALIDAAMALMGIEPYRPLYEVPEEVHVQDYGWTTDGTHPVGVHRRRAGGACVPVDRRERAVLVGDQPLGAVPR